MNGSDFEQRLRRVEVLVERIEALPDAAARESARELVATTLELHARGLGRMLELLAADPQALAAAGQDPVVAPLLLLHGLHPLPLAERLARALGEIEPRLARHGARLRLLGTSGDTVSVLLSGDPSFEPLVRESLSAAAPEVGAIRVELADPSLVQLGVRRRGHDGAEAEGR